MTMYSKVNADGTVEWPDEGPPPFTRADVDLLQRLSRHAVEEKARDGADRRTADAVDALHLAHRLAALLPPREEQP